MKPNRYGVYYLPAPTEPWAAFCTAWLGWDVATGQRVNHPEVRGINELVSALTTVPRRYGLHATLKPPFRLQNGKTARGLERAFQDLADRLGPVTLQGLELTRLGRFLALTVPGDTRDLNAMAATIVRDLDGFRAQPTAQELARRRVTGLSPAHDRMLVTWGYPYVMDQFRFHITLTGKLPRDTLAATEEVLSNELDPILPVPFRIAEIALVGEDDDGFFHVLEKAPLSG